MAIIPENRPPKTKPAPNGDGRESYLLMREIIALSNANDWHKAKDEWLLEELLFEPDGVCLCGHSPITEQCLIRNRVNGNTAVVGNVCVTRFLGLDAEAAFRVLRPIRKNPERGMSAAAIEYAFGRGWLNDWERRFYLDTLRRQLSARQRAKRVEINRAILRRVMWEGRGHAC